MVFKTNKKPTNWLGRQNTAKLKFEPKPTEAAFSAVFSNVVKCPSEVAGDVMSGVAVDQVGVDVRATSGESRLNSGQIIRVFGQPDSFCALLRSI